MIGFINKTKMSPDKMYDVSNMILENIQILRIPIGCFNFEMSTEQKKQWHT